MILMIRRVRKILRFPKDGDLDLACWHFGEETLAGQATRAGDAAIVLIIVMIS